MALRSARKLGRPLVLVFNNVHFFQHTEEGKNILLQLQQRAEAWAQSGNMSIIYFTVYLIVNFSLGILTMVFSTSVEHTFSCFIALTSLTISDDHWPFHVLRMDLCFPLCLNHSNCVIGKSSSRMQVISIYDLSLHDAAHATQHMRLSAGRPAASDGTIKKALMLVGGRLSHISRVASAVDVPGTAAHMLQLEKGWLLSNIGLIPDCDIDALDEVWECKLAPA